LRDYIIGVWRYNDCGIQLSGFSKRARWSGEFDELLLFEKDGIRVREIRGLLVLGF
jgi:hypothetical protein